MTCYPLSKETWVKPTHLGAMLYSPVDAEECPEQANLYSSSLVLDDLEIVSLIGWWAEQHSQAKDDRIEIIVELVHDHQVSPRAAAAALRVLMCQDREQMLAGWVADVDDGEGIT